MKISQGLPTAGQSLADRLVVLKNIILTKVGVRKALTERQRYEAAIDASAITAEQRRKAMENAAAAPGIIDGLDRADQAIERHLKGLEPGELQGRSRSPGPSGR